MALGLVAWTAPALGAWFDYNVLDHLRNAPIGVGARVNGKVADRFGSQPAELRVNCVNNSTVVYITSERMIIVSASPISWSLDGGAAQRGYWQACQENNCLGLWNGAGIPFLKSLFDKSTFRYEIQPTTGGLYRGEFDVTGAKEGLRSVGVACGWLPKEEPKKP